MGHVARSQRDLFDVVSRRFGILAHTFVARDDGDQRTRLAKQFLIRWVTLSKVRIASSGHRRRTRSSTARSVSRVEEVSRHLC